MKRVVLAVILAFLLPLCSCTHTENKGRISTTSEPQTSLRISYQKDSNGWYWVYQGIAHAQSLLSTGESIQELIIRVAKLNNHTPMAPLEIEARNSSLDIIYAHGSIHPDLATLEFKDISVSFDFLSTLKRDTSYVLIFFSKDTSNISPWIINAIYADIYPEGRHLGYADDFFFIVRYDNESELVIGPKNKKQSVLPVNSGSSGGMPYLKPLMLSGPAPIPGIAGND